MSQRAQDKSFRQTGRILQWYDLRSQVIVGDLVEVGLRQPFVGDCHGPRKGDDDLSDGWKLAQNYVDQEGFERLA